MKKCSGSVDSIETMGLVDGPGIRTVVFLTGCKLRCLYCHNPEMWTKGKNNYTPEELVKKIIRNKPYFGKKGGVTFSGGEPLLQIDFLVERAKKQNPNINEKKIRAAYECANAAHEGQKRKNGEPYIIHPVSVAEIIVEMGLDTDSICAGLLHDCIEDTEFGYKEIENKFGTSVAELVDGVTRLGMLRKRALIPTRSCPCLSCLVWRKSLRLNVKTRTLLACLMWISASLLVSWPA